MLEQFTVTITPFDRDKQRTVRVYLPRDYESSGASYPVLYMHDGQNLFRDSDAAFGLSWGIADYLDKSGLGLIVVGIDCSSEGYNRMNEYAPWANGPLSRSLFQLDETLGGRGGAYIDYIVQELKPVIDSRFRTVVDDTSMAGSSMGGHISTYAACRYPHIFRKIASFSSAYWFNQHEIETLIRESDLSGIRKFYMDVGSREQSWAIGSRDYIEASASVYDLLKEKISDIRFEIIDGAEHNEAAWRARVPDVFRYLFG